MVQNDEWGASDGQCVTTNAGPGFAVTAGNHNKNDAPAAYPSIMSGCWMGTCTKGTTLPTQISQLGPISSSIAGTIPPGAKSNMAYDIWADTTPKKNGQNNAMELMIWLKENGGIKPIGNKTGAVSIGGANWDVWKGTNGGVNVISYVRQGYVDAADNLPITDFVKNAVQQGSVKDTDFLTNIQAGFEPWTGGPGLQLTKFSVANGQTSSAAQPGAAGAATSASPQTAATPSGAAAAAPASGAPGSGDGGSSAAAAATTSAAPDQGSSGTSSGGAEPTSAPPTVTTTPDGSGDGSSSATGASSGSGSSSSGASSSSAATSTSESGQSGASSGGSEQSGAPTSTTASSEPSTESPSPEDSGSPTTSSASPSPATGGESSGSGAPTGSTSPSSSAAAGSGGGANAGQGGAAQGGAAPGGATGAIFALTNGLTGMGDKQNEGATDPAAAPSPNVPGRTGVKFTIPGGGKRTEVLPSAGQNFKAGDHKFFGYSAFLDKDFAVNAKSWQVIWQLHDNGVNGSPPVALEVGQGSLWLATHGNDHDKNLGPIAGGQDVSVQLEVQFAQGGGFVNVWRDGKQVVANYKPPSGTMVDGGDYLKTGIYRDPSETQASTLTLNDLKIGDSLASVGNLAGAPTGAVAGAALPLVGVVLVLIPVATAAIRRRRRSRDRAVLPRPRPAFEPPSRTTKSRKLQGAGR